jgi:hypothetical protein
MKVQLFGDEPKKTGLSDYLTGFRVHSDTYKTSLSNSEGRVWGGGGERVDNSDIPEGTSWLIIVLTLN